MAAGILKEHYNLQEKNNQNEKLIRQKKDHLVSVHREITEAESKIQEKLTVPGGIQKQQGKNSRQRKHINILEDKLNQDTIKFDELLCNNTEYREQIDHLLHQIGIGSNIEEKYNSQLAIQRNIMEKLGETLDLAAQQRSEAENRMLEARESIDVETVQFTKRQMQLKTLIKHNAKLHTFMERKLQEIIPVEDDEDSKMRKKLQQYQSGVKKLEMYVQGHSTLVKVTRESDPRQIGHKFIWNEQKNLAHISYINELHNRWNKLKNCTDKMKSDNLFLQQESKGHDEQSESEFKDLESALEKYSCLGDSLEKQCTVVQRTLEQLKTAINVLLNSTVQEEVTVTPKNIAHFTGILEEIISNLLIQANNVADKQMELPPHNLLLANSELLPEYEEVVEAESGRSTSRSLKSA
ncbi:coiled-coil domain-containing protein 63-like [Micropterus dolomieu]|uniref:coiled-coil domain-containing protein 63-like n=1 Tax=Micropterus dolomieu TaxID=147949 RepID=UPI001E8E043A|nr:coiled-coil domain-containing protein 63-like [Micropterus dolomieu]